MKGQWVNTPYQIEARGIQVIYSYTTLQSPHPTILIINFIEKKKKKWKKKPIKTEENGPIILAPSSELSLIFSLLFNFLSPPPAIQNSEILLSLSQFDRLRSIDAISRSGFVSISLLSVSFVCLILCFGIVRSLWYVDYIVYFFYPIFSSVLC